MIISTTLNDLNMALSEVVPVLNDALLQEDAKNILFWVKDKVVKVITNNMYITCVADMSCNLEFAEGELDTEEYFVMVRAKELQNHINSVSSLKMTKVEKLSFDVRPNEIRLSIYEVAASDEIPNADKLNQVSRFRLTKCKVVERIKTELREAMSHIDDKDDYTTINKADVLAPLDALIPAVKKETRDSVQTRITFADDYIYVVPQTYVALMRNELDDVFKGFIITNSVAQFMQSFFNIEDVTEFKKTAVSAGNVVMLILRNSTATAVIKAMDIAKAFNITNQKVMPSNGIAINKAYFLDVLKRISTVGEEISFKIHIKTNDSDTSEPYCQIVNKVMNQYIPVVTSKGTGDFSFMIKPDMLSNISLSYLNDGANYLFLYLGADDSGKTILCITDDVLVNSGENLWHTYTKGLSLSKGDYQWN